MERLLLQVNSTPQSSPEDSVDTGERGEGVAQDSELAMAGVTLYQLIKDHFRELIW